MKHPHLSHPVAPARDIAPASKLLHELRVHQIELELQNEELRRTQVALEESRDRYAHLYDFAPVGYFSVTSTGLITEVNLTGSQLLGAERKGLMHRRFGAFISPEQADEWQRQIQKLALHGGQRRMEMAMLRADNSRFYGQMDCLCQPNGDKMPLIRIALTDITECRHTEEELRIAAIAFESQEGMLVTNAAGKIVRVNQAFTRVTGYSPEEALGQPFSVLKSDRHGETFHNEIWARLQKNGHWQGEIWIRCKNGKVYAEWVTLSAVIKPDGHISHYVGTLSDIAQNAEAEAEIYRLAYYDPLTQLPNRRLLLDRISQAMASSSRSEHHGAVIYLDLDNFKPLNDTRGHDFGDLLLIEVAERLRNAVREGDTIARLGGDEFVMVLENLSSDSTEATEQARQIAEKVHDALSHEYTLETHVYQCTASFGISLFRGHTASINTVLQQADRALYQAKALGRNRLHFFSAE